MAEKEKRGRPDDWKLTNQNNRSEGQNGERGDAESDWVDVIFESLAEEVEELKENYKKYHKEPSQLSAKEKEMNEIYGERCYNPTQNYVIKRAVDVLGSMRKGSIRTPTGDYIRAELDRKQKADIDMITLGFMAVAYEHIHGGYQATIHEHFRENLTNTFSTALDPDSIYAPFEERVKLKTDTPFDEFRREFKDRFELTYEQAKVVQKIVKGVNKIVTAQQIAKRVNLSYDPGGREPTPENIAKRTFRAKDYVNRPIDHSRRY